MWDAEECQSPRMGSAILGVDGAPATPSASASPPPCPSTTRCPSSHAPSRDAPTTTPSEVTASALTQGSYPAPMINDCGDKPVSNSVEVSLLVKIVCCFFFFSCFDCSEDRARETLERVMSQALLKARRRLLGRSRRQPSNRSAVNAGLAQVCPAPTFMSSLTKLIQGLHPQPG